MPAPTLEHVCDLDVVGGEAELLGPVRTGVGRVIPIAGGTVSGPLLSGTIEATGADWQTVLATGAAELDARYLLRTDDGAAIEIVDRGFELGPPDVMDRLAGGEVVDPGEYYMRTSIRLETGDERYAWVNTTVVVGTGCRTELGVTISVNAVR